MKVNMQAVHFSADSKLIDFIEKKLSKLNQYFDRIIEANVFLKLENSGQIKDKIVEIRLNIPGSAIHVKETSKTFETSIDQAVAILKRQLIKYKDRFRRSSAG